MTTQQLPWHTRLHQGFRTWRREMKARMPYVRRRVYRKAESLRDDIAALLLTGTTPCDAAPATWLKVPSAPLAGEVCLFVTHATRPVLKPHVVAHVGQLLQAGVKVVLIVNTDLPLHAMRIEAALQERLAGVLVRANLGLDFAAWGHACRALCGQWQPERLLLVNDSIVGPLDDVRYRELARRIRASSADVIGLTESFDPRHHLQSFYLVFNARALPALQRVLERAIILPTKDLVIDVYETRLTGLLAAEGLRVEAMFPTPARSPHAPPNDTVMRWSALVQAGFPFVKASVLDSQQDDEELERLVPSAWRTPR